jgi:hypothetical protein
MFKGNQFYRIYYSPLDYSDELRSTLMDIAIGKLIYSPTGQVAANILFTQENMVWTVKSLSDAETKVTIDYDILPYTSLDGFVYGVKSLGHTEKYFLDQLKSKVED